VGDTNVLETMFRTATGRLRLVDLMPVTNEAEKRRELWPNHQVLRRVECVDGEVELEVLCDPRPDYGRTVPRPQDRGAFGFRFHQAPGLLFRSEIPVTCLAPDRPGVGGQATLRAGERRYLSLTFNTEQPAVVPPFGEAAERKIAQTLRWWEEWSGRCRFEGPHRDHVVRSALALKLMTYAPSGAVVAAPTTSLPESLGGGRNWDYRYCWLRDASLTLSGLMDLGYEAEGVAFLNWLFHAIRLTAPDVRIMYDVFGESRLKERELDHLEGYAGSRPVRIGNDAVDQFVHPCGAHQRGAHAARAGGGIMNLGSALLWGFVATIVLTTLMAAAHALRITRMSIPFLLGTMFTPDRARARLIGFMAHLMNGWVFALVYALAFRELGPGHLVAGRGDRAGPRVVRPRGRHAAHAGDAPPHGQRGARPGADPAAPAARRAGAAVRRSSWCPSRCSRCDVHPSRGVEPLDGESQSHVHSGHGQA
jgi:hypothetical protein